MYNSRNESFQIRVANPHNATTVISIVASRELIIVCSHFRASQAFRHRFAIELLPVHNFLCERSFIATESPDARKTIPLFHKELVSFVQGGRGQFVLGLGHARLSISRSILASQSVA